MSEVVKIVKLLSSPALEKRIAAAIVLGELKAKGPEVVAGLGKALESGIPLLQRHALEALAQIGSKKVLPQIFAVLEKADDEVRRAATKAIASVGEEALPLIKARIAECSPHERQSLDAALAELGGKDAFGTLILGLASSDSEAAQRAALAVRQQVKGADGRTKKSFMASIEKFLHDKKAERSAGAIAAAVKILGYFEDEATVPMLLAYAGDAKAHPSVRKEAIIAFRFALTKSKASAKVTDALVECASAPDGALALTALHTLGSLDLGPDGPRRIARLAGHPDFERARFVIEHLGRLGGPDACRTLVNVLTSSDKRYAELATQAIAGKEEAVPQLAKAVLETKDRDRAWTIRNVLRPMAKKVTPALRKELLAAAMDRLKDGELGWEAALDVVRDADPAGTAEALRVLAAKLRKAKNEDKAAVVLRLLAKTDHATDDDRYELAILELGKSTKDTRPASRAADEALRALSHLKKRGFDVSKALRKDRGLTIDDLYYVGFHFSEEGEPLGVELLEEVVKKAGRTKIGKMAKNKLALVEGRA
jgi:HEAT repeat protein